MIKVVGTGNVLGYPRFYQLPINLTRPMTIGTFDNPLSSFLVREGNSNE